MLIRCSGVKDAYDVLSDESKRAAHDRARIAEGGRGDNDQEQGFDEEFDSSAYAESDSDDADELDEDDDHQQEPDAFRKKIFEQATPYVNKVLANRRDTETLEEIDDLNKQIRLKNQEEGLRNEKSFLIPFNVLVALGLEFSVVRSNLRKNKDDQDAWNKLDALNEQLQKLRRVNHYPQSWRLQKISGRQAEDYKDARTDRVNGADGHPITTSKKTDTRSGTTSESTQATGSKATNSQATGSDAASSQATSSGSSLGKEASDKGEDLENRHLVPGLTKNGDKILGYRPFYQTNRRTGSTHLHGVQFVVEKRGSPNPIVLLSGAEVGNRVTDAYLGLPDSQKKDVRHSEEKYSYEDADNFEKLLGFATKAMNALSISEPTTRYPGYGLVKFKTGEVDILSRTAFRKMLGKKDADDEIETFFPKQSQLIEPARARGQLKAHEYDSTGFTRRAPKSGNLEGLSDSESMFITEERSRGRRTTEK